MSPGANVIKIFSVIYRFSYLASVFVRIDWKSLPMTNIVAYYENLQITEDKSFIKSGPGANVIKLFPRDLRIFVLS
jgi:hypothetical protein